MNRKAKYVNMCLSICPFMCKLRIKSVRFSQHLYIIPMILHKCVWHYVSQKTEDFYRTESQGQGHGQGQGLDPKLG